MVEIFFSVVKLERTPTGLIELRLSANPDEFVRLAEWVRATVGGNWKEQIDGLDQSYWDLAVSERLVVTVHREHYSGVSVFCPDLEPNVEVLESLRRSLEKFHPGRH